MNVNRATYSYRIRLQAIDREFVEEFDRCLSSDLGAPRHATWRGAARKEIHVVGSSFLLHQFLSQPFENLKPYIEHCDYCVAAFLRGFFDSEGCVSLSGSISASNCDVPLLEYVQHLLTDYLKIGSTGPYVRSRKGSSMTARGRTYVRNSDCYEIRLRNRSRQAFLKEVGITIERKRVRLLEHFQMWRALLRWFRSSRLQRAWRRDRDFPPSSPKGF